jgi:hypothetical protein
MSAKGDSTVFTIRKQITAVRIKLQNTIRFLLKINELRLNYKDNRIIL